MQCIRPSVRFIQNLDIKTSISAKNKGKETYLSIWWRTNSLMVFWDSMYFGLGSLSLHRPWTSQIDRNATGQSPVSTAGFSLSSTTFHPLVGEQNLTIPPFPGFHCKKPDGAVACQAFHLVLLVTHDTSPSARAGAWTTSFWDTRRPSHCSQF